MPYNGFYPGGWKDDPNRGPAKPGETPMNAAAMTHYDQALQVAYKSLDELETVTGTGRLSEQGLNATYAPASGIAKAALATPVQASIDKAETAVQPAALTPIKSAVQFLSDAVTTQKTQRMPDNVNWLTTFANGHGWTTANPGSVSLNSANVQLFGGQGIEVAATTSGNRTIDSPNVSLDLTGKLIVLAVRSLDGNAAGFYVRVGNADMSAYRTLYANVYEYRPEAGWVFLTLHPDAYLDQTGTPDMAAIQKIRIVHLSTGSNANTVQFGGVGTCPRQTKYPNGVVTIDFDDSATGQFTIARPLLIARGMPATICTIAQNSDTTTTEMTPANMHMLEESFGWEIGAHCDRAADHVVMSGLSNAQIEDSILRIREWLTSNGFRANYFAYPGGGSNSEFLRRTVRTYFSLARRTDNTATVRPEPVYNPPQTSSSIYEMQSTVFGNGDPSVMTAAINTASARKQHLSLTFHGVVPGASSGQSVGASDLATILDLIASKGMAVTTPSRLFGLSL
ncbi:polysaccharide deacetylase family protein [Prescottella equi]|uniref:polysaccharide deacetylase family protein n=1 Tax=Rhodococcus hoagii TaxID=43767 RepID=UPI000A121760|nr:polysaccharide deacetylase family protein [Prescottella equi]ORJ99873.1 hypothetical protein A6F58_00765 [Prescottella equi]